MEFAESILPSCVTALYKGPSWCNTACAGLTTIAAFGAIKNLGLGCYAEWNKKGDGKDQLKLFSKHLVAMALGAFGATTRTGSWLVPLGLGIQWSVKNYQGKKGSLVELYPIPLQKHIDGFLKPINNSLAKQAVSIWKDFEGVVDFAVTKKWSVAVGALLTAAFIAKPNVTTICAWVTSSV